MRADELPAFFDALVQWAADRPLPVETVAYGEHADQVIDLRRPPASSAPRLALVLHGGFWRAPYTRRNTTALSVALAEAGWASANVEYRRLGPGRWRPMLDDVLDARRALDAFDHVVAVGHSAGGHLALWLAAEGAVDAAVGLGAVCDLRAAAAAGLGDDAAQELLGGDADDVPDAYGAADPAVRLPLGVPQVLVHGGDDDRVPLSHARDYAERARAAGDDCRVIDLAGGHFEPIDPRSSAWQHVLGGLEAASAAARPGVTT
jgi:acetyl esterase/lipase